MSFDQEWRIVTSPRQFFEAATTTPKHLVDFVLSRATPRVFPGYKAYCDFLVALSEHLGVHPQGFALRGSCLLGFSVAPKHDKAWKNVHDGSDLDLAIIDADYYDRINGSVIQWEERGGADRWQGTAALYYESRRSDRFYNCCRIDDLPRHLCAHYAEAMISVAQMKHCGLFRKLTAFLFRDWYAFRQRWLHDLKKLAEEVRKETVPVPGDELRTR